MKASLIKHKGNGDIEPADVYFSSVNKIVINSEYMLEKSFQEILYRIDNWINEGSGWMIEFLDAEYVNIFVYSVLSRSTYIKLLHKLRH